MSKPMGFEQFIMYFTVAITTTTTIAVVTMSYCMLIVAD